MAKVNKENKNNKKYNAENEIIIGVTTKPVNENNSKKTKHTTKINNKKINNSKNYNRNRNAKSQTKENVIKKKNRKVKIVSALIVLFIAICGTIYYLTTPVFNISTINVYGYENNSEDTYISLSKIVLDETNIFQITSSRIKKYLKENAYVEDVSIKRKLPNILEIYVEERKVEYQIKYNDKYMYINNQGYVLEINEEPRNVIEIIGFNAVNNDIRPGERLNTEDLIKLDTILKIVNSYKFNNIEETITSIDVTDYSNYILNLDDIGKVVYLGDASNLSERILWLKTILRKEEENKGIIFINGDLSKDKVYFKEKE